MKLDPSTKIMIVGLGLMGGSYARGLKKNGYQVSAIDANPDSIAYALQEQIIDFGYTDPTVSNIGEADLVVFALYPKVFRDWIDRYQSLLKSGSVITDVTGVKSCIVYDIQNTLRNDVEYIAAHPMAGREVYGVQNSTDAIFRGANYIIVSTDRNTFNAIQVCKSLGETLGFANISSLPPRAHDEMIGFVSQLTHCIAVSLMTCSNSDHLVDYTGDSFRDLTRIAKINENMWCELFLLNRDALLAQMKTFMDDFQGFYEILERGDEAAIKEKMRKSTAKRALFDR